MKARVRELQANRSEARIRLADGTTMRGEIVRVEEDSFTVREKETGREVTLQFTQTTGIKKKGLSKAIWIPILIGGATLAVFCAAPYPIGFLCREDPS